MDNAKREELVRIRDSIVQRKRAAEKLLKDVDKVSEKLENEIMELMNEIGARGDNMKALIDSYVKKAKAALFKAHEENVDKIDNYRVGLEKKVEDHRESIVKINEVLEQRKHIKNPLVNVSKVYEMVVDSLEDAKSLQVNVNLKRCELRGGTELNIDKVKHNIGVLHGVEESLYGIMYPITFSGEFKTPNIEINAISPGGSSNSHTNIWVCFCVKKELINYSEHGKVLSRIACDFKVNDIVQTEDGRIFATAADGKSVRCISRKRKQGEYSCSVMVQDSLYLHGLTLCNRTGMFAACATDAPNYTDRQPSETVVIEYTYSGKEFRRVMVSNFAGKVYRIAQNIDDRYVLTFPKEGAILSVDGVGNIRNSFTDRDFQECNVTNGRQGSEMRFWPSGVCCDAVGHVIVTEWTNALVILLDKDLNILRHIGKGHSGPNAVCYDLKWNTLFIGDKESVQMWKTCPHLG